MAHPRIEVGMYVVAKAPLDGVETFVSAAQDQQLDSVFVWDHLQDFFPSAIWDEDFAWFAVPDEVGRLFGLRHPFGEDFRGFVDILPEAYDRQTVEEAIAAVPREMMEGLIWGSPEQVLVKLRAFEHAGMRHVMTVLASAAVSPEAAAYGMETMAGIARALRSGRPSWSSGRDRQAAGSGRPAAEQESVSDRQEQAAD